MALIESISGIRGSIGGKVGENLTPLDIVKFTTAYSRFILQTKGEGATVVLGRDARISGEMVNSIIEGTLLGCGINVINVGLCTTPGVELAVVHHHAQGGIIITASHNEKEWNALKLLNDQGEFLNAAEGDLILNYAKSMDWEYPSVNKLGVVKLREDFNDKHIAQVLSLSYVDVESIRARKLKIVVDAVNSVGGVVIPKLLRELGCEVVEINCTPNGDFAHNPEPLPEHLTQISEVIRTQGADLGVVVDPDVDRLALV